MKDSTAIALASLIISVPLWCIWSALLDIIRALHVPKKWVVEEKEGGHHAE